MHIVIVGAGVVGLSLARSALARGYRVTVLDQADVPNPNGASFDQHRMIRYQYGTATGYARMVAEAFPAWERVWAEIGAQHFTDTGALSVSVREGDYGSNSLAMLRAAGLPVEEIDAAAIGRIAPQLVVPPHARGVLCRPGGPLYADRIVTDLARLVTERGAVVRARTRVAAVDADAGVVLTDSGERVTGDVVVVAAGAWLRGLDGISAGEVRVVRQVLCYVEPPAAHVQAWKTGPALVVLGDANCYSLPPTAGTELKFGSGDVLQEGDPADGFVPPDGMADRVLSVFAPYLKDAGEYRPGRLRVGYYVRDATRRFRLLQQGRAIVVTNCDGQMFKFGPLIGERLIEAIAGRRDFAAVTRWMAGEEAA